MKVEIKFTIDLKEEYNNNQGDVMLPESYEDMMDEIKEMFQGRDLDLMLSKDAKILFKDNFTGMFNY